MVETCHKRHLRLRFRRAACSGLAGLLFIAVLTALAQDQPAAASSATPARAVGTVKGIAGNTITLTTDAGTVLNLIVQDSTRILLAALGQKDLRDATPLQLSDIHVGDRMLVRGKPGSKGQSLVALSVVVMREADIAARQEHDREDWRKRGIGGLVKAVDLGQGTITVSVTSFGASKAVDVKTSKSTIVRHYAPDSVKFDDAKPGTLDQIKPGDQLRARGTRSADGSQLNAEEIVSGTFRNIAGTVISTDAANRTISVKDLATRQAVMLRINDDSQLRNLPPMMAERIARRLKGESQPASENGNVHPAMPASGSPEGVGGGRAGGPPDFQQMLNRMPAVSLAELQKGSAVMLVATEGSSSSPPTAITLLSGVEPILTASPDSSRAAMLLSPWNLSGTGGEAALGTNP